MKNKSIWLLVIVLILAGIQAPGLAQPLAQAGEPDNPPHVIPIETREASTRLWFIEFNSPALIMGGSRAAIQTDQIQFHQHADEAGLDYGQRFAFSTLWNGISIEMESGNASLLTQLPSVKAVFPIEIIPLPETSIMENPQMTAALAMTGADIAQSELGLTGAGIRVAVIDTGIDYLHPDLGGCFGTGCRVETGWDFVGDDFDNLNDPNPSPDNDPMDCNGHGTHVAGIVGAKAAATGGVTGVAPDVTFGAYRVFGCTGSTTSDIILAAMERALQDDMDVLNMSIGSAYQWPQYPTAVAADELVEQGMVVVASIGNSGATGLYSAGAPGVGNQVIGVASFENTHITLPTFTVTPANTTAAYSNATAAPPAPLSGSLPLAKSGSPLSTADACLLGGTTNPFTPGQFTGQAVLIRRGTCTFFEKSRNAQDAGAVAVVIYNNTSGSFTPNVAGAYPITIPVVAISDTEGVAINNAIDSESQTLNWQSTTGSSINPGGGLISSSSSYGLAPDLSLKPDIGAPGGMIRSTYPISLGSYTTISGTSMAAPHVAGAVALLLEDQPGTPANEVRGILQNSAEPKPWWGIPGLGYLDNVHRQGAGMLQVDKAIKATTHIKPAKIATGEGEIGPFAQILTLENYAEESVTYDLSYINAISTGGIITPSFFTSDASVVFNVPSITIPPGGSATVEATIHPATTPLNGQFGGYIVFTPQAEGQTYRVPFAGFVGDYQGIQVLAPGAYGLPLLTKFDGSVYWIIDEDGEVFSMEGNDIPLVLAYFQHQSNLVRVEILPAGDLTKEYDLTAFRKEYHERSSSISSFFEFPWDGTAGENDQRRPLPNGDYRLRLTVLKALGDPENPAHWETWTSPMFSIVRNIDWDVSVSPANAQLFGDPGSAVNHTLTITNTGTHPDAFELEVSQSTWNVDLDKVVVGPLDPGESATVGLQMHIPGVALAGDSNTLVITITSQVGDETATASASLTVTANPIYGLLLTPNVTSQSEFAGKTVSYQLVVNNTGNIPDAYDVIIGNHHWTTSIDSQTIGPLPPGGQATLTVTVSIPEQPALGSSDTATISIKSKNNAETQAALSLTTHANHQVIYLPFTEK